ncbi:MAG: hypothetical protein ACRD03_01205 [Acidimicrobiales bacterium]
MNEGYVYAGYGVTLAALGLYALRVLRRGRSLRRTLADAPGAAGPPAAAPRDRDGA